MKNNPRFVFFGTPDIAVFVLEELARAGMVPALIVTNPDAPQGRKMILTESPVAHYARMQNIPVIKPSRLRDASSIATLSTAQADLYIVAAYGKIIPKVILDIPIHGVLNVHPSLLPKLRGPSPIRSAILENEFPTGVTIMKLTEGLDEGPMLAQEVAPIQPSAWPLRGTELDEMLARMGGALLAKTVPQWLSGTLTAVEQDHKAATYTKKITKDIARINLADDPELNLRKIRAFAGWPVAYYLHEKNGIAIRVKILDAEIAAGELKITRVIPEGRKEMRYEDFLRGI